MRDDVVAVVHVAGEPLKTAENPDRIVQPCQRCGIVLSEFDGANPPSFALPFVDGDTSCPTCGAPAGRQHAGDCDVSRRHAQHSWWEYGANVSEAYGDGKPMACPRVLGIIADDHLLDDDVALCDPDDVPEDTETRWEISGQDV